MSVYKDTKRNHLWYCQFYYTDWKAIESKRKQGLSKKREAQKFERMFLEHFSTSPDVTFKALADKYYNYAEASSERVYIV